MLPFDAALRGDHSHPGPRFSQIKRAAELSTALPGISLTEPQCPCPGAAQILAQSSAFVESKMRFRRWNQG